MTEQSAVPLYLDCDTGIDDALAIGYLLASPRANLLGIGSVSGNVSAAVGAINTLDLLALAGREDIPVASGAHHPLVGEFAGGAPHVHGENGIGGVELESAGIGTAEELAAEMLIRLARENPGELHVLAIGPLTNLALALRMEPELPALVKHVTIMGGAAMVPGNITAAAEANIANDAEAAAEVLAAGWDITLVPLDVTMDNVFEEEHRQQLLAAGTPMASALGGMLGYYFDFYTSQFGRPCSAMHDPLAAAIAVGGVVPGIAPRVNIQVDATAGPGRGQTICDLRGRFRGFPDQPGARTRVVLTLDEDFSAHLVGTILGAQ